MLRPRVVQRGCLHLRPILAREGLRHAPRCHYPRLPGRLLDEGYLPERDLHVRPDVGRGRLFISEPLPWLHPRGGGQLYGARELRKWYVLVRPDLDRGRLLHSGLPRHARHATRVLWARDLRKWHLRLRSWLDRADVRRARVPGRLQWARHMRRGQLISARANMLVLSWVDG